MYFTLTPEPMIGAGQAMDTYTGGTHPTATFGTEPGAYYESNIRAGDVVVFPAEAGIDRVFDGSDAGAEMALGGASDKTYARATTNPLNAKHVNGSAKMTGPRGGAPFFTQLVDGNALFCADDEESGGDGQASSSAWVGGPAFPSMAVWTSTPVTKLNPAQLTFKLLAASNKMADRGWRSGGAVVCPPPRVPGVTRPSGPPASGPSDDPAAIMSEHSEAEWYAELNKKPMNPTFAKLAAEVEKDPTLRWNNIGHLRRYVHFEGFMTAEPQRQDMGVGISIAVMHNKDVFNYWGSDARPADFAGFIIKRDEKQPCAPYRVFPWHSHDCPAPKPSELEFRDLSGRIEYGLFFQAGIICKIEPMPTAAYAFYWGGGTDPDQADSERDSLVAAVGMTRETMFDALDDAARVARRAIRCVTLSIGRSAPILPDLGLAYRVLYYVGEAARLGQATQDFVHTIGLSVEALGEILKKYARDGQVTIEGVNDALNELLDKMATGPRKEDVAEFTKKLSEPKRFEAARTAASKMPRAMGGIRPILGKMISDAIEEAREAREAAKAAKGTPPKVTAVEDRMLMAKTPERRAEEYAAGNAIISVRATATFYSDLERKIAEQPTRDTGAILRDVLVEANAEPAIQRQVYDAYNDYLARYRSAAAAMPLPSAPPLSEAPAVTVGPTPPPTLVPEDQRRQRWEQYAGALVISCSPVLNSKQKAEMLQKLGEAYKAYPTARVNEVIKGVLMSGNLISVISPALDYQVQAYRTKLPDGEPRRDKIECGDLSDLARAALMRPIDGPVAKQAVAETTYLDPANRQALYDAVVERLGSKPELTGFQILAAAYADKGISTEAQDDINEGYRIWLKSGEAPPEMAPVVLAWYLDRPRTGGSIDQLTKGEFKTAMETANASLETVTGTTMPSDGVGAKKVTMEKINGYIAALDQYRKLLDSMPLKKEKYDALLSDGNTTYKDLEAKKSALDTSVAPLSPLSWWRSWLPIWPPGWEAIGDATRSTEKARAYVTEFKKQLRKMATRRTERIEELTKYLRAEVDKLDAKWQEFVKAKKSYVDAVWTETGPISDSAAVTLHDVFKSMKELFYDTVVGLYDQVVDVPALSEKTVAQRNNIDAARAKAKAWIEQELKTGGIAQAQLRDAMRDTYDAVDIAVANFKDLAAALSAEKPLAAVASGVSTDVDMCGAGEEDFVLTVSTPPPTPAIAPAAAPPPGAVSVSSSSRSAAAAAPAAATRGGRRAPARGASQQHQ